MAHGVRPAIAGYKHDNYYDGLALSDTEGERMAKIPGDTDVLFLGDHGVITAAPTVAQAFDDLYFVERAAQAQMPDSKVRYTAQYLVPQSMLLRVLKLTLR
ncbi:MAG: class II aldolase/adducin family protein [Methylococcales bacterium]|nr:class II aldolase/adducin family protein [Methylococcales bacterium]